MWPLSVVRERVLALNLDHELAGIPASMGILGPICFLFHGACLVCFSKDFSFPERVKKGFNKWPSSSRGVYESNATLGCAQM